MMAPVNRINVEALHREPPVLDHRRTAGGGMLTVSVDGQRIFCIVYLPQGEGPHPVALMLHGLPGTVRGEDLAQALRRAGMGALIFSYRGSWGSEGSWSYRNAYEDTLTVCRALRNPETAARFHLDPERIVLLGHSLGGQLAVMAARDMGVRDLILISPADPAKQWRAAQHSPEAMAKRLERLTMLCEPLRDADPERIWSELGAMADSFDLLAAVGHLRDPRVLLIGAAYDHLLPLAEYLDPVAEALERNTPGSVATCVLPTGHNYNSHRLELARAILGWLRDMGY
jgi:pimeloyl-ACP methyl ester carboxylesterase